MSPLCDTGFWHVPSGWLSDCLRIKPFTDYTVVYMVTHVIIFLYRYYYLLFIVHEYWEFNPYALSCHPLINVLYIYRDSIHIQYTRSFYNVEYKLPINFTYCFEAFVFTYTVAQYILAWLAYRLALDFFTSGPYLQRKIHPIK